MKHLWWYFVAILILVTALFVVVTIRLELSFHRVLVLEGQMAEKVDREELETALGEERAKRVALRALAVCNLAVLRSMGGDEASEWFAECVPNQLTKERQ